LIASAVGGAELIHAGRVALAGGAEVFAARQQQRLFTRVMRKVETVDVLTPPDKAVFYSGPGNQAKAFEFKMNHSKLTIENTPGGRWLGKQDMYNRLPMSQADIAWGRLSERYAQEASGEVNCFVSGARRDRIFFIKELPALENNSKVTGKIFHD